MPKYPKNFKDVTYYAPTKAKGEIKLKKITGSTKATSDFLALVHEQYPEATIEELLEIITDKTKFILCPEAVEVLEAHVDKKLGKIVPN